MTDEDLKIECLKLAVEAKIPSRNVVEVAEDFLRFIRAMAESPKRPQRTRRKY